MVSGRRTVVATDTDLAGAPVMRFPFQIFSPDGKHAAIPRHPAAGAWMVDVVAGRTDGALTAPGCHDAFNVAWSEDGKVLAVGTDSGRVCLYDVGTRRLLRTFAIARHRVTAVTLLQFTPDGSGILAGADEPMGPTDIAYAESFRVATGRRVADLGLVYGGFAPLRGGALLYSLFGGFGDYRILTRGLTSARAPFADLSDPDEADPLGLPMSADGAWVAKGATLLSTDGLQRLVLPDGGQCHPVAFDPTGTYLLGIREDRTACLWALPR